MQPTQDFSTENLLWMRGRKVTAALRKSSPPDKAGWEVLAKQAEEKIAEGTFKFRGLFSSSALGKQVLSTCDATDALVLRKINDNIRRSYGIRQTQRSHAVKLVKKALSEWTPKGIVSVDLKSCFETITPNVVIEKLKRDGQVSHQTIHLLETFFKQTQRFGANKYSKGLPRGVLISSTLAELFLKGLDREISCFKGVYVYVRYVDDILALCAGPAEELFSSVSSAICEQGLKLNKAKCAVKNAGCTCAFECNHPLGSCPCDSKCKCKFKNLNLDAIDYLGYKFIFSTGMRLKSEPTCYTIIATSKSKKIKTRIIQAITSYRSNNDYSLLLDRIRLLTKNVTVDKSLKRSRLKSGIAFTYDQYAPPPIPHPFENSTLEDLDKFLKTKLRRLCSANKSISYMQKQNLIRNSFEAGHSKFHRISFDPKRMTSVRSCWNVK